MCVTAADCRLADWLIDSSVVLWVTITRRLGTIVHIPAISAFLGPTVTSECILPFIENAIYDVEERVVLSAVHSLTALAQLGLLSTFLVIDFAAKCKGLLIHPSESLR